MRPQKTRRFLQALRFKSMLAPVFEFFDKLIEQFSWRRLLFIVAIFFIFGVCIIIYESYTGHFRLSRLGETIDLLHKVQSLPVPIAKNAQGESVKILESVLQELEEFSTNSATAFDIHPTALKGMAAFTPWLFLIAVFLMASPTRNIQSVLGMLLLAIPFSLIGAYIPTFQYSWINYWVYPVVHCVLLVWFVLLWNKRKKP